MNITITWSNGGGYQSVDGYIILYRETTPTNTNNWILATDPELPPTQTQYTLTGLTPNILYDIAVVKSCASVFDVMSTWIYSYMSCPVVSTWQGPVVNNKPTLFYSVYYQLGTDIQAAQVRLYESTPDVFEIADAVGNGTSVLYTTTIPHNLLVNSQVVITGINPSGYNISGKITQVVGATNFVIANTFTGLYSFGGQVTFTPGMQGDLYIPRTKSVVGKTAYKTINGSAANPPGFVTVQNCGSDGLAFVFPNNTNSVAGYFGTEHGNVNAGIPCGPSINQNGVATTFSPILLEYNTTLIPREYKLGTVGSFDYINNIGPNNNLLQFSFGEVCPGDSIVTVTSSFTFDDDVTQPYRNLNVANSANISAAICFDDTTGIVDYTFADGLGRTNINDYTFSFTTSDGATSIPLVNSSGVPVTSYNGTYNIYAPVKIETYAPGGGNPAGYTITNAVTVGSNTTYTYTGGTNAFTVGQEVFVNSVNPPSFDFVLAGVYSYKTITAATANTFTVSYIPSPASPYQTGGIASAYIELTAGMKITVDIQPGPVNVITLTNQNYAGLTLKQALDNIANSINTTTSYTASAAIIAGLPYLKINVPGTGYVSGSIIFEGPNILTKGAPDILQTSDVGTYLAATISSVSYNGFLYAAFRNSTDSYAKIVASDINNPTVATNYSHTIDLGVGEMVLIPEAPPTTAYSLDHVVDGGNHSLNITVDGNGYNYSANNTTVSIYDGTSLIDSQDLSLLPGGPTTPIRLMEFNTNDNTLYVFVEGTSNNFYIVDVAPWSIVYTGTYGQTSYFQRGTITAWNNLTNTTDAAMGTITSIPIQPIPCATIPCPSLIPTAVSVAQNDGVNSALFQDNTKTWAVVPPGPPTYSNGYFSVYNYTQQILGYMLYYDGTTYNSQSGMSGDTIRIGTGLTLSGGKTPFLASNGDSYGIFAKVWISDYNATPLFTDRTWSNLSRYAIDGGRNITSNGFLSTIPTTYHTDTTFITDYYPRYIQPRDNAIVSVIGLDDTSEYLLYDITDGGTCYNQNSNTVFISLDGGIVEAIDNLGGVTSIDLYKDFPATSSHVQVPLQMVADPNSNLVYGIARDARSDIDDMNIYVFDESGQVDIIDGSALWNVNICGQISIDSATGILYFTGKHTRNFYEYDPATGAWDNKIIPSVYEKMNGFTYGTASPLSRFQGVIERVQGASYIGGGKFVVMNYMQQTFSTELKYVYEVTNLFVYDYTNNTVDQVLIGSGVNTYSGTPSGYNPNYYGEYFGMNDYNNDYCYGGLGIKVDSNTGRIYWKKSVTNQIYFSEAHTESGVAQIWSSITAKMGLVRIWNIQSNGSLQQSKRTIIDNFSTVQNLVYDSFHNRLIGATNNIGYQFYFYNTQNLAGGHSTPNTIGIQNKTVNSLFINGITPSLNSTGKPTFLRSVSSTATEITFDVNPTYISPGVFPHHYAVGDVITIGPGSVPALPAWIPTTNIVVTSVTPTSFTISNPTGNVYPLTIHQSSIANIRLSTYFAMQYGYILPDNAGNVSVWGSSIGGTVSAYTSMFAKYNSSDLFTQRESPEIIIKSAVSTPCSAAPNGIFKQDAYGNSLMNFTSIKVNSQGTLWLLGSKNPTCNVNGITGAAYDSNAQRIRYYVPNSFSVGKVVTISGVIPSAYSLSRVPIVAVDPTWFEISYTAATAPPAYVSGGSVALSTNWVIEVVDFTSPTFNTLATIDLTFANSYIDQLSYSKGSFQYSAAENRIYLYYADSRSPVYIFDTITNSLIRSSSFNRMVLPYAKLSYVYTLQDANGFAYFGSLSATVVPDNPTRRWFRLDAGDRTYQNDVHNLLDVSITDVVGTTTTNYDLYNLTNLSDTFGQWKEITDTTWATIPSTISTTLGATIEFTSFILDKPLVAIRNLTQGTTYSVSNALNSIKVYTILVDSINLFNGDLLEFEFTNPDNPSCPFINQSTITF